MDKYHTFHVKNHNIIYHSLRSGYSMYDFYGNSQPELVYSPYRVVYPPYTVNYSPYRVVYSPYTLLYSPNAESPIFQNEDHSTY